MGFPLVLMVDDNANDLDMGQMAFEEADIRVEFLGMHRPEQALDHLRALAGDPDAPLPKLVLIDLNMPRIQGEVLLAFLKNAPRLARIPVVVLTTSNSALDRARCLTLGAAEFQVKPFRLAAYFDLFRTFRRYFDDGDPHVSGRPPGGDGGPAPAPAPGAGPPATHRDSSPRSESYRWASRRSA